MKNRNLILGIIIALLVVFVVVIVLSTTSFKKNESGKDGGKEAEKVELSYTGDISVDKSRDEIVTTQSHKNGDKAEFTVTNVQEGDSVTFTFNVENKTKGTAVILDPPSMETASSNDYYTMISFSSEEKLAAKGGKGTQTVIVQVSQTPPEEEKTLSVELSLSGQASK